jgi:hypothetical protein
MARHTGLPVTEPSVASRNRAVDSERQPIEASEVAQWAAFYESDREAAVADWDELYREGRPTDPAGWARRLTVDGTNRSEPVRPNTNSSQRGRWRACGRSWSRRRCGPPRRLRRVVLDVQVERTPLLVRGVGAHPLAAYAAGGRPGDLHHRFHQTAPKRRNPAIYAGLPYTATGIRTPVSAVRGRRPSPLDDGGPWRAILATRFSGSRVWRYSVRVHFSAGGTGKSGAKPARSRHCERALRRRTRPLGSRLLPGKARRGAPSQET